MRNIYTRILLAIFILGGFSPWLNAETRRVIPLDMFLIIDGSDFFQDSKADALAWVNSHVVDRILQDGDRITIWRAGDSAQVIHTGYISGNTQEISNLLNAIQIGGRTPDFSSALIDAAARASRTTQDRLAYTMLVTASAAGLQCAITGDDRNLLRWFRSEREERWQVLVIDPHITPRVQNAAASLMAFLR